VVVDVTGKVRRPGIATLPEGSRVVDALRAAGGARRGASLAGLNLARVLSDGEQVVVGVAPASGTAASLAAAPTASTPGALVNINTAAQPELESLPGVGPVTAQKILAYRQDNGAFSSVDQLLDVSGIGEATLAEMAPFCTI
jgi:competence protein ComEA